MVNTIWKKSHLITLIFFLCLFSSVFKAFSQHTGKVKGKLIDSKNQQAVPFASVLIKNTNTGTTSDPDGVFELTNVPEGERTLVISFVGYQTKEVEVIVVRGKTQYSEIQLDASVVSLDDPS